MVGEEGIRVGVILINERVEDMVFGPGRLAIHMHIHPFEYAKTMCAVCRRWEPSGHFHLEWEQQRLAVQRHKGLAQRVDQQGRPERGGPAPHKGFVQPSELGHGNEDEGRWAGGVQGCDVWMCCRGGVT